jgi:hypothetical protein
MPRLAAQHHSRAERLRGHLLGEGDHLGDVDRHFRDLAEVGIGRDRREVCDRLLRATDRIDRPDRIAALGANRCVDIVDLDHGSTWQVGKVEAFRHCSIRHLPFQGCRIISENGFAIDCRVGHDGLLLRIGEVPGDTLGIPQQVSGPLI